MMRSIRFTAVLGVLVLVAAGCTRGGGKTTLTVLDYYGEATPFSKAVLAGFEKEHPKIDIAYQVGDWDSMHDKFTVRVSSGDSPDVATMDMTWIPTFASKGIFADLTKLSGGKLNGQPITDQYAPGALEAMTFQGHYVTMMFDFDAYALYYRADQFKKKGIQVPTNWNELRAAAQQLAEDTNGDGKNDKYLYGISAGDCFHWCQFLYQNGGSILNQDDTAAAFNDQAGLGAMETYKGLLDDGSAIYWTPDQGDDFIPGIKDERIGMFQDGPYYMGLLKESAPDQAGKWAIATAPYSKEPGSYLGGTGLSIPVNAPHPKEAWQFIQYMLRVEQEIGVYTLAGAAPATVAALQSPEVTKADPYFGGQKPFQVFLDTMATATPFPYIKQWDPIDEQIGLMVDAVMLGKSTPQEGLAEGAAKVNEELAG